MDIAQASLVVQNPRVSEKGTRLTDKHNQYVFDVALESTKPEIKMAIQRLFKVTVLGVRTLRTSGKEKGFRFRGRRPNCKKAIVTLKSGEKIEFIPGI